jgi:hypothetical protein
MLVCAWCFYVCVIVCFMFVCVKVSFFCTLTGLSKPHKRITTCTHTHTRTRAHTHTHINITSHLLAKVLQPVIAQREGHHERIKHLVCAACSCNGVQYFSTVSFKQG